MREAYNLQESIAPGNAYNYVRTGYYNTFKLKSGENMWRSKKNVQPVDSRIYKYWEALYLSYYSSKFYIDVAKRWRGFGVSYFFFFFLIAAIPFSIKSAIDMNNYITHDLFQPTSMIPEIKLVNGKIQFDKPMPFFVKNDQGKDVIIIDTTGQINEINKDYPDVLFLINSSKIHFKFPQLHFFKNDKRNSEYYNKEQIETQDLSELGDDIFTGRNWLEESGFIKMKNRLLILIYPLVFGALFGIFTTGILALSILGQVAAYSIFKQKLRFKQTCRISVIASSIGIWLYLCLKTFGIASAKLNFMCMAIVFVYFSYGVLAVKRSSKSLVHY